MYRTFKSSLQIFSFLALSAGFLMSLAWLFSIAPQNETGTTSSAPFSLTVGQQSGVLVGVEQKVTAAQSSTLAISKKAISSSASVGSSVDFTILITNTETTTASDIIFTEIPDPALSIVGEPIFSSNVVTTPLGTEDEKKWELDNLPGGQTAVITVTTQLLANNSECDTIAQNKAQVIAPSVEITAQDQILIEIQRCVYLPYIRKDPTPTPTPTPTPVPILYSDDFSNDNSGWFEGDSDDERCDSDYDNGQYRIAVDDKIDSGSNDIFDGCFRPAPGAAFYTYGLFEVDAWRDSGDDEFAYGIYINGKGGDEQYIFAIRPNECKWDLIRSEEDEEPEIILQDNGVCSPAINRSGVANRLAIRHTSDGRIRVYVNGTLLGTHNDGNQLNDGRSVGVYVQSGDDKDYRIRFDNFRVKSPDAALTP